MNEITRIVGVSTSPRENGNTEFMIKEALSAAERLGTELGFRIETELVTLAKKKILPCYHCGLCVQRKCYCLIKDDWLNTVSKLIEPPPAGLIVGAPVYFFRMNSLGRAFFERFTCLLNGLWVPDFPYVPPDFSQTAAGAIAIGADRYGGAEHTVSEIIHWFLTLGFAVVGGFYIGAAGWTREDDSKEAIQKDELGLESAKLVGQKVLKTALLLKRGASTFEKELPLILWKEGTSAG